MKSFNDYLKQQEQEKVSKTRSSDSVSDLQEKIDQYSGRSQQELYAELNVLAEQGKKDGTLTKESLKSFEDTLSPMLNDEQKQRLDNIMKTLKKGL